MLGTTLILWITLLGIFCWCTYWHVQENRQLTSHWKQTYDEKQYAWLTRFAWSRSIQLLLALAFGSLVIIFYSIKLDSAQDKIETLSARKPIMQNQQQAYYPPNSTTPDVQPVSPPAPAALPQTQPTPQVTQPAQPVTPTVQDIYKPDEDDSQSAMDALKQRYEDMLVIHFFLDRCGKVSKNDYYIIMAALSRDMASVNAPGRMQHDVLTAAQGSYNEMYSKSLCDAVNIDTLQSQYAAYIQALSEYSRQ